MQQSARESDTTGILARAAAEASPSDPLRARILDAACAQFTRFGLRRSTIDDVARRAGVSRVTVYRRVGTKERLVQECLLREYRRFTAEVDAAVRDLPSIEQRLEEGFVLLLRYLTEHRLVGGLLRLEPELMLPYLTVDSGPHLVVMRDYLATRLRHAQRTEGGLDGDPTPVAELMVRITVSFLLNPVSCFALEDAAQARQFVRRYLTPLLER